MPANWHIILAIMAEVDIAQEWRRLQSLYAGMSEEELEAVANEGYELTDVAKQALTAEISRRGLQVIVRLAPGTEENQTQQQGDADFDPANLELGSGCIVWNREQAAWVRKTFTDAGIPCYFGPNLAEDIDGLQFPEGIGAQVKVLTSDLDRARYVLRDFDTQFPSGDADDETADLTVRCPTCQSTEIVFEGLDSEAPDEDGRGAKYNWNCDTCGYQWTDDGVGAPT